MEVLNKLGQEKTETEEDPENFYKENSYQRQNQPRNCD